MGKPTINGPFSIATLNYQRVWGFSEFFKQSLVSKVIADCFVATNLVLIQASSYWLVGELPKDDMDDDDVEDLEENNVEESEEEEGVDGTAEQYFQKYGVMKPPPCPKQMPKWGGRMRPPEPAGPPPGHKAPVKPAKAEPKPADVGPAAAVPLPPAPPPPAGVTTVQWTKAVCTKTTAVMPPPPPPAVEARSSTSSRSTGEERTGFQKLHKRCVVCSMFVVTIDSTIPKASKHRKKTVSQCFHFIIFRSKTWTTSRCSLTSPLFLISFPQVFPTSHNVPNSLHGFPHIFPHFFPMSVFHLFPMFSMICPMFSMVFHGFPTFSHGFRHVFPTFSPRGARAGPGRLASPSGPARGAERHDLRSARRGAAGHGGSWGHAGGATGAQVNHLHLGILMDVNGYFNGF